MSKINFVNGDATSPIGEGNKIIVHVCNDIGGWGKGFVVALSKKWKQPEAEYRKWHASQDGFELGKVQLVQVEEDLWIANLIGQHKIMRGPNGEPPIRYSAIKKGIVAVHRYARELNASVHMPRIGCGLAGGEWNQIQAILDHELGVFNIPTTVYDFDES